MPYTFEIRPLAALPWPPGLGKQGRKRQLEKGLTAHLGEDYFSPEANRRALEHDSVYREIVRRELEGAVGWTRGFVDIALEAAQIASGSPLLGVRLSSTMNWADWARQYRGRVDDWVCSWLMHPPAIAESCDGDLVFEDGRHRVTYLRLHCVPATGVLVGRYRDDDA